MKSAKIRNRRKSNLIIFLAIFHRYGWIALMLLMMYLTKSIYAAIISCFVFSIWTFLGYKLRWTHIYCSYQNANREPMTPDKVNWNSVRKTDAYGIPAIFFVFGVGLLLLCT